MYQKQLYFHLTKVTCRLVTVGSDNEGLFYSNEDRVDKALKLLDGPIGMSDYGAQMDFNLSRGLLWYTGVCVFHLI